MLHRQMMKMIFSIALGYKKANSESVIKYIFNSI